MGTMMCLPRPPILLVSVGLLATGCVVGPLGRSSAEPTAPAEPTADEAPAPATPEPGKVEFYAATTRSAADGVARPITTWTLGEPLFVDVTGAPPNEVFLFAEVNGELAGAAGGQLVGDDDALAGLSNVSFRYLGHDMDDGWTRPSPYGVWSNLEDPHDRVWTEFHHRVVPMLQVGDNTLKLTIASNGRSETYAEGTLTIHVPSAAALTAELAANQEVFVDGDAKLLKAVRKLVVSEMMPNRGEHEAGELVAIGYAHPEWTMQVDDNGVVYQDGRVTVIYRLPSDGHAARCRATAVFARRDASTKSGVVWDAPRLGGVGLETRWTPCPVATR